MRAVTYAKLGRVILAQPGQVAWQVYDAKVAPLLHEEYRHRFSVFYRNCPSEAWRFDGSYFNRGEAERVAHRLRERGFETFVRS